jgi:hypothetical protein
MKSKAADRAVRGELKVGGEIDDAGCSGWRACRFRASQWQEPMNACEPLVTVTGSALGTLPYKRPIYGAVANGNQCRSRRLLAAALSGAAWSNGATTLPWLERRLRSLATVELANVFVSQN